MKILIIDDEADIRLISKMSLSRIGGMEVIEADNGPDGVRRAEAERPDAILLDVMMPLMDGPTTLAALRKNAATADIPVIFLTAKVMDSEISRLRAMGVAGVLPKPFDPLALPGQVQEVLQDRPRQT
jgi:CheY-like chemotaxis protein